MGFYLFKNYHTVLYKNQQNYIYAYYIPDIIISLSDHTHEHCRIGLIIIQSYLTFRDYKTYMKLFHKYVETENNQQYLTTTNLLQLLRSL